MIFANNHPPHLIFYLPADGSIFWIAVFNLCWSGSCLIYMVHGSLLPAHFRVVYNGRKSMIIDFRVVFALLFWGGTVTQTTAASWEPPVNHVCIWRVSLIL